MADALTPENLTPKITVIGAGGAGGNAVNNMIRSNLEGVNFVTVNTDAQALKNSQAPTCIQLGLEITQGLGAGSKPQVGRAAAEESLSDLEKVMRGSHMVFITAGMGGGTGTGAAPVIARAARDMGILTVGVVTKPFHFEGIQRMRLADQGIQELQHHVDTLIIIPNQNLFRLANEQTTFADAFNMADGVLYAGVRGITDLMIMPGLINLDFADVKTVMSEMGKAMMGTGEASGENRAIVAAEAAISNPLLDEVSMRGARGVLINITGGLDMTLYEVDEAANRIREEVDGEANIIFGSTFDDRMSGTIRVSVVATGIDASAVAEKRQQALTEAKPAAEPQFAFDVVDVNSEEKESLGDDDALLPSFEVDVPAESTTDALEDISAVEESTPTYSEEPPQVQKKSLWQRLGFEVQKKADAPAPKADDSNAQDMQSEDVAQEALSDENDKDLDIPAFLRRLNKS
jgi:cell division protein FtsZ